MSQIDAESLNDHEPGELTGKRRLPPDRIAERWRKLILVVDGDAGVRDLTRDILERYGYTVLTAGSKGEAWIICEQRNRELSVIFIDILVLESDDTDLLEQLFKMNSGLKVVITSVYSHDRDSGNLFVRGASGFLKKPYRMLDLLRTVERMEHMQ